MAANSAGEVVALIGSNAYQYFTDGLVIHGGGSAGGDPVQYALDNQGQLYTLSGGALTIAATSRSTPQQLAAGVTRMAMDAAGEVVILQGPNSFAYYGGPINTGGSSTNVQYALDGQGDLYTLRNGDLTMTADSTSTPQQLAAGVTRMAMDAAGEVVILQGVNSFAYYGGQISTVGSSTGVQYALDAQGDLFALKNGVVTVAASSSSAPQQLATQVVQLVGDSTGQVYVLDGSGILAAYEPSSNGFLPAVLQGDPQAQLVLDGSGQVYSLDNNGTVYAVNGDNATAVDYLTQFISLDSAGKLKPTYSPIGVEWHNLGGSSSFLGNPISAVQSVPGGSLVDFRGGEMTWSQNTGAVAIPSAIAKQYDLVGGPSSYLGLATKDAPPLIDLNKNTIGSVVVFQGGAILANANGYVTDMTNHIWSEYQAGLGAPLSRQESVATDVEEVTFTNGVIYWSPLTGGKSFQFNEPDPALTPTNGLGLTGGVLGTLGNLANIPTSVSFSAEGTLSLNLMQQTAYADLDFDGIQFDSSKLEDLLNGELALPSIDPMEVLTSLAGSTVSSCYDTARETAYKQYGAANVYFSSERFVDWASPQTVARLAGQAVLGAGDASLSELQNNLGAEMQNLIAWASRGFGNEDQAVQALSAAFEAGKVKVNPVAVKYNYSLFGKTVPETHLGFEIVIPGFSSGSLAPLSSLFSTATSPAPAMQGVSPADLQSNLVKLATYIFNQALKTNLDPSSFDLGDSIASNLVNTALYRTLYGDLEISPSALISAYQGEPVIAYLMGEPDTDETASSYMQSMAQNLDKAVNTSRPLILINQVLKSLDGIDINANVSFHVEQLEFNTSTYELTAKAELTFTASLGNPLDIANRVGQALSNFGKTEGAKAVNWFKQEGGDLASWWDNDVAKNFPSIPPLGSWASDAESGLQAAVSSFLPNIGPPPSPAQIKNDVDNTISNGETAVANSPTGQAISSTYKKITSGNLLLDDITTLELNT